MAAAWRVSTPSFAKTVPRCRFTFFFSHFKNRLAAAIAFYLSHPQQDLFLTICEALRQNRFVRAELRTGVTLPKALHTRLS